MSDKFKLVIRTPDETIFNGEVDSINLETETGEIEIFSGHASLASSISYTKAFLRYGNISEEWVLRRGTIFFSGKDNTCHIAVNFAREIYEIDITNVEDYIKLLEEKLEGDESISNFEYKYLEGEKLAIIKQLSSI